MTNVPEAVSSRLPDFLEEADTPVERVRAMTQTFSSQGFYSDGSSSPLRTFRKVAPMDSTCSAVSGRSEAPTVPNRRTK